MTVPALLRRFAVERQGTAAMEFVLTLPVMLTFMAGIIEFSHAYQVYGAVDRLATRYAIAWADCSDAPTGACATELALYTSASTVQNLVPQLSNPVQLRMFEVSMAGSAASVVYASPSGATPTAGELSVAQGAIASGQTGVVVTVTYTHTLVFFQQIMAPILGSTRTVSTTVAQLKS